MYEGKLFWDDEQRLTLLALLLENVGATPRSGSVTAVWQAAIRDLPG